MTLPSLPAEGSTAWTAWAAAVHAAIGTLDSEMDTHTHPITDLELTGTPGDDTFISAEDGGSWQVPPGSGSVVVYNDVKWDSVTETWPTRPAVPASVPVQWFSVNYPTAGAPPDAEADDIWYPHADELA